MRHILLLLIIALLSAGAALAQTLNLGGEIALSDNRPLANVKVVLYNDLGQAIDSTLTTCENNRYAFSGLVAGAAYELALTHTQEDVVNGVTTLDIVLITRFILGISQPSSTQLVAADADDNGQVNVADLLWLRRLVLGINPSLPGPTWRFAQRNTGTVVTGRWPVSITADESALDFTGIKTGDINLTATSCL